MTNRERLSQAIKGAKQQDKEAGYYIKYSIDEDVTKFVYRNKFNKQMLVITKIGCVSIEDMSGYVMMKLTEDYLTGI